MQSIISRLINFKTEKIYHSCFQTALYLSFFSKTLIYCKLSCIKPVRKKKKFFVQMDLSRHSPPLNPLLQWQPPACTCRQHSRGRGGGGGGGGVGWGCSKNRSVHLWGQFTRRNARSTFWNFKTGRVNISQLLLRTNGLLIKGGSSSSEKLVWLCGVCIRAL